MYLFAMMAVLYAKNLMTMSKWKIVCIADCLIILGACMMMEDVFWNIVAGRFVMGLGGGLMTVFVPMSVSTMSPPEFSGPLGMLNQIMCCVGIITANLVSLPMPSRIQDLGEPDDYWNAKYWRVIFSVPVFIGLI